MIQAGAGTKNRPMEVNEGDVILYEPLNSMTVELEEGDFDLIDSSNVIHIEG